MKILVINPNTTVSMTHKIATAARAIARSDTEIMAASSQDGPASIQGFLDVATCIPGLLAEVSLHPDVDAWMKMVAQRNTVRLASQCISSLPLKKITTSLQVAFFGSLLPLR